MRSLSVDERGALKRAGVSPVWVVRLRVRRYAILGSRVDRLRERRRLRWLRRLGLPVVCVTGYSPRPGSEPDRFVRLLEAEPGISLLFQFWNLPHGEHRYAQVRERFAASDAVVVLAGETWFSTSHAFAEMDMLDGRAGIPRIRRPVLSLYFLATDPAAAVRSSLQQFPGTRPNHRILSRDPATAAAEVRAALTPRNIRR